VDNLGEAIASQNAYLSTIKQLIKKQSKLYILLEQKAQQLRAVLPTSEATNRPPIFNELNNYQVRNTCSTLYKMNIVTGDSSFGLSYIDNTTKNMFNDSCNYNYYNIEVAEHLNFLRNGATPANATHNMQHIRCAIYARNAQKYGNTSQRASDQGKPVIPAWCCQYHLL
jgi:hypothetical protein